MPTDDADLVGRCLEGDLHAFEELYRRHAVPLYNLSRRMCGSAADAEDLLQEVFLLAHRKLATFKGESTLGTWLHRLTMNHCLDFLRSRGHRMAALSGPLDAAPPGLARREADPVIERLDLERAISQLPPACRAAFLLHDVEGFEHQEVARILDVAEGTSKSQVHKARMRIRALLGHRGRVREDLRDVR